MGIREFFERICQFVTEVAYGEAALRSRGLLPPLSRSCVKSATAVLKASKPDYKAYFEYMNSKPIRTAAQRADRVKGNRDVQATFDNINDLFGECGLLSLISWHALLTSNLRSCSKDG